MGGSCWRPVARPSSSRDGPSLVHVTLDICLRQQPQCLARDVLCDSSHRSGLCYPWYACFVFFSLFVSFPSPSVSRVFLEAPLARTAASPAVIPFALVIYSISQLSSTVVHRARLIRDFRQPLPEEVVLSHLLGTCAEPNCAPYFPTPPTRLHLGTSALRPPSVPPNLSFPGSESARVSGLRPGLEISAWLKCRGAGL
jgi:hypothetical protein